MYHISTGPATCKAIHTVSHAVQPFPASVSLLFSSSDNSRTVPTAFRAFTNPAQPAPSAMQSDLIKPPCCSGVHHVILTYPTLGLGCASHTRPARDGTSDKINTTTTHRHAHTDTHTHFGPALAHTDTRQAPTRAHTDTRQAPTRAHTHTHAQRPHAHTHTPSTRTRTRRTHGHTHTHTNEPSHTPHPTAKPQVLLQEIPRIPTLRKVLPLKEVQSEMARLRSRSSGRNRRLRRGPRIRHRSVHDAWLLSLNNTPASSSRPQLGFYSI